jgi:hypothetical protein
MTHNRAAIRTVPALVLALAILPGTALAMLVETTTHTVGAFDNLYFDNWGHGFINQPGNAGEPADVVELNGSAFNMAGFDFLNITAEGLIADHSPAGGTWPATNPDGLPNGEDNPPNNIFRGLTVYALIGIWSTNPNTIAPLGTQSAFVVGSSLPGLPVPDLPAVYLFLGDNDGLFSDNSGFYTVTIEAVVPLPSALVLFMAGLLPLLLISRRQAS